jgi:hypothetical protein
MLRMLVMFDNQLVKANWFNPRPIFLVTSEPLTGPAHRILDEGQLSLC